MWLSKKQPLLNKLRLQGTLWIAADVHLGPDGPKTASGFYQFLADATTHCDALLLCGDIFNAWIGDDEVMAPAPWLAEALHALQKFSRQKPLYLMRGNRDFLMGDKLAKHLNATLLADQVVLSTKHFTFLLSHGDELCTDDVAYQRFRRIVRSPITQTFFNTLPFSWRKAVAQHFRTRSKAAGQYKSASITDVNSEACAQALIQYGVHTLVHGHTSPCSAPERTQPKYRQTHCASRLGARPQHSAPCGLA